MRSVLFLCVNIVLCRERRPRRSVFYAVGRHLNFAVKPQNITCPLGQISRCEAVYHICRKANISFARQRAVGGGALDAPHSNSETNGRVIPSPTNLSILICVGNAYYAFRIATANLAVRRGRRTLLKTENLIIESNRLGIIG